jgi:hypothetical protein
MASHATTSNAGRRVSSDSSLLGLKGGRGRLPRAHQTVSIPARRDRLGIIVQRAQDLLAPRSSASPTAHRSPQTTGPPCAPRRRRRTGAPRGALPTSPFLPAPANAGNCARGSGTAARPGARPRSRDGLAPACRDPRRAAIPAAPVVVADEAAVQVLVDVTASAGLRAGTPAATARVMSGPAAAMRACARPCSRSSSQRAAIAGLRVLRFPTSIGDLFRCTLLIGRRVTPSGRSALRVNRRWRMVSASSANSSDGSWRQSQTSTSFLLVGWVASGHTSPRQPRSAGNMPDTCRKGWRCARSRCRPISAGHLVLAAQFEAEVEQLRLLAADQARQRDGGAHVGQRVVRRLVHQAVGARQVLQPEAGLAVVVARPLDAVRTQRIGHAHHVEQVPAAAAVLPFARIRVDQVAPEQEARDFVVEADGVVADADRARLAEGGADLRGELVFGHPVFQAVLRRDAGDQAGLRIGQEIGRRLAVQHDRLADLVEVGIGADRGELGRAIAARHAPKVS